MNLYFFAFFTYLRIVYGYIQHDLFDRTANRVRQVNTQIMLEIIYRKSPNKRPPSFKRLPLINAPLKIRNIL